MSNGQGSSRITESERGPNRGEAYGMAAITQLLQGIQFPVSKEELIRLHGNQQIQWTKNGESYRLEECLRDIPVDRFSSITEITAAISNSVKS